MSAKHDIENLIASALSAKGLELPAKANVEPPRDKRHGDMASNVALILSKELGKKPRDLAEELRVETLALSPDLAAVDVAGPGFLNFTLTPAYWRRTVNDVLKAEERFGAVEVGRGRKVQVEFVSANPTGPLHIGHGRGAAVGDSLARLLRFAGFDVTTEYYLNDAGRQMRTLGASVLLRLRELKGERIEFPEDHYRGDYIKDIAGDALQCFGDELSGMDEEQAVERCRAFAVDVILAGIKEDLRVFGVDHQIWFSEKSLLASGAVERSLLWLKERDLAYEQEGALWFRSTSYGDDKDRVLRKSDGSLTYFASDIAYHREKFERGFDIVVDIWGADHHGYEPRMKAAVQALGKSADSLQVVLVQLVNLLRNGEQIAMSTRAGAFDTLAEVVAETGPDAARYIFLSRKSDSHLDFDLELVKQQTMDNPVYYVQYGHARICSLMRKAQERDMDLAFLGRAPSVKELSPLDTPEDLALLQLLSRFPDIVGSAAESLSPHSISFYLQELAASLHRYYTEHPVLTAPSEELARARLWLLAAVAQVFRNGLGLLGVSAPERM
jgi:arginyl-tRNA synthetase